MITPTCQRVTPFLATLPPHARSTLPVDTVLRLPAFTDAATASSFRYNGAAYSRTPLSG